MIETNGTDGHACISPDLRALAKRLMRMQVELASIAEELVGRLHNQVPMAEDPGESLTKVEKAMQIYLRDPNQSLREVARQVPCTPSLLYRSQRMQNLLQAHVRERKKGQVP